MSAKARPSAEKRRKEQAKRERKLEKAERRARKREERATQPDAVPEGEDPDIAHIQPGPQPPLPEFCD